MALLKFKKVYLKNIFKKNSFELSLGSEDMNMNAVVPKDGYYEPWLIKYLEITSSFYGADKDALDIGANIGLITLILASLQSKGSVIAFEPLSMIYNHLIENIRKNKISNVTTHKKIVSNDDNCIKNINVPLHDNIGASYVSDQKESSSAFSEEVETITLDRFVNTQKNNLNIKIIKIDVECWEKYVLEGARKTIEEHQPVAFIEFNVQERTIETEVTGKELFEEINNLFKHVFLIDRLTQMLMKIDCYSNLKGAMLTGHFVEDLLCFNDIKFLKHIQPYIVDNIYTSYHAAKISITKKHKSLISSFSHYPDNWNHGHDFFIQIKNNHTVAVNLTFLNPGMFPNNRVLVIHGNITEEINLERKPLSRQYFFDPNIESSIYIFIEKKAMAKDFMNINDPRDLGIQIKIETVEK